VFTPLRKTRNQEIQSKSTKNEKPRYFSCAMLDLRVAEISMAEVRRSAKFR